MTWYLGVDVSAANLDTAYACGDQEQGLARYENNPGGWQALRQKATALAAAHGESTVHLIIEPTGGYERGLVEFAHALGWAVTVVNPYYIRRFAQGQGTRGKSDRTDARMLARYGRQHQPPAQWQMAQAGQELQSLLSRQDDLQKLLRAERNRLLQARHNPKAPRAVLGSIERTIDMLAAEEKALDAAIQELLSRAHALNEMAQLLCTVPGVGRQVVRRLLTLFYRFQALTASRGTANQLVAFLGLDPQPFESGRSVQHRPTISRMGDKAGRAALFMGALGGIRGDNPLRAFYDRLIQRGKAKKLALVACSRKILVWAWAIFSSGLPFDPHRTLPISHIAS